ncbi:MAG: CDP-alcohol phosphatidyltransferase [Gammaproteobacteria bacterium]|nr:CDP-alcohol phosphatidyltransferase [Gammaproteobacteria bacterium]|tara:strand:- start:130 stop:1308 length:1179 start_codon:yes stop_codon:yes gene_type:complete
MGVYALILGESDVKLWGLTPYQRLERQIAELPDCRLIGGLGDLPDGAEVLCVRADFIYETRTLLRLMDHADSVLYFDAQPAAGFCAGPLAPALAAGFEEGTLEGFASVRPADLAAYEDNLRKAEEPLLLPVEVDQRDALQDRLYGRSYKGITDLVTKWFWPRPAKRMVRWCASLGITPNMVTLTGLLLVVYAGYAFYLGDYWLGLTAGWFMTFLDTVDGKLARVTIKSSRIGHVLDHGMDIIHPPFWYLLWGMSLQGPVFGWPLADLYWWTFAGYIGGRLIEAAFHGLGSCSLFDWRPFDAYFRLVTGRRNPCLIIMTVALLIGSPEAAFIGVVGWTVLSSAILLLRLAQASAIRLVDGPLVSWLADPVQAAARYPTAFRTFSRTRGAYREG